MFRYLLILSLLLPLANTKAQSWTCKKSDGTKVFQDHPCGDSTSFNGVMDAPRPRVDDSNPGWCSAYQGWLADTKRKAVSAPAAESKQWREKEAKEQSWLKLHHCH